VWNGILDAYKRLEMPFSRSSAHRRSGIMPGRLRPFVLPPSSLTSFIAEGPSMDTVTAFAPRRTDAPASLGMSAVPDTPHTLAVTATYRLSEEGRKASLLAGGDGRGLQELIVNVPSNRLHLVSVDLEGVARLKLRPRYEEHGADGVRRIDDLPTYDLPPAIEDLFREAARNHQLERAYEAERRAAKERQRDASQERRTTLAQAFLADPAQRALVHPAPTPKRCYITAENGGRILFDADRDAGVGRDLVTEAHRRFRADLRARREHNLQERAAQFALHEEKKRILGEFIAEHGTTEQRSRQDAGVLPIQEAIEAFTDHAFAALRNRRPYARDGHVRLQAHLSRIPEFANALVMPGDLTTVSTDVTQMTAAQWALVNEFKAVLPEATVTLRQHKIAWKRNPRVVLPPVFGILVTQRVSLFTLRREYAADSGE
jgi:hypothetical protein